MPSSQSKSDRDSERFRAALSARAFEIEHFWKRSIFFWGFISAAFVAYAASREKSPLLGLVMACFGAVCSLTWTLLNRGSKYWQETWEAKVAQTEEAIVGRLFRVQEPVQHKGIWLSGRRFSVSKLTIALSDYVFILWLALTIAQLISLHGVQFSRTLGIIVAWVWLSFSSLYMAVVFRNAQATLPKQIESAASWAERGGWTASSLSETELLPSRTLPRADEDSIRLEGHGNRWF